MANPIKDIRKELLKHQDMATEIYICKALGMPLPDKYKEHIPNISLLKDVIKIIHGQVKDVVLTPFEVGELKTISDVRRFSSRVISAYCEGEITGDMMDRLMGVIRGHRQVIESEVIGEMLEQLKLDHTKALKMKQVGRDGSARFIPEVIETLNEDSRFKTVEERETVIESSRFETDEVIDGSRFESQGVS